MISLKNESNNELVERRGVAHENSFHGNSGRVMRYLLCGICERGVIEGRIINALEGCISTPFLSRLERGYSADSV